MKTNRFSSTILAAACGCALLAPQIGSAIEYNITVPTASLGGNPAGPFYLDFQLNDGSGIGDGNNMASVTGFAGLTPLAPASTFGNAFGSIGGAVSLKDSQPFNELFQSFTAGPLISFNVFLTQNVEAGGTPDEFSFAILNGNLQNIPTTGLGDSLFSVSIPGTPILGSAQNFPGLTAVVTVPDAASPATLAFAMLGLVGACRFMKRQTA